MIDPKQLQALVAVHAEGSFLAAARALGLTPAAITQRVKALEANIGSLVLIRGKALRLTPQGQSLLTYSQRSQLLDQDLRETLQLSQRSGRGGRHRLNWQTLRVAINADSLATWFLPGVQSALSKHQLLLDVVIDDQDHTHEALNNGDVIGCITTLAQPIQGCLAEPIGALRYRAVANQQWLAQCLTPSGRLSIHRLLAQPAVVFNRKDAMHDRFLAQFFELRQPLYPKHFVPALDAFERAIALGLGWGMVVDMPARPLDLAGDVVEVLPDHYLMVPLYWQHWEKEPKAAASLTQAVKEAALRALYQTK